MALIIVSILIIVHQNFNCYEIFIASYSQKLVNGFINIGNSVHLLIRILLTLKILGNEKNIEQKEKKRKTSLKQLQRSFDQSQIINKCLLKRSSFKYNLQKKVNFQKMHQQQFDWYGLSKLNTQNPNVQDFSKVLKSGKISKNFSQVPHSLRKKLLQLFQTSSEKLKNLFDVSIQQTSQLNTEKGAIIQQIGLMEESLESSLNKVNCLKSEIDEKKNHIVKLKQKVNKKKKETVSKSIFFCPFCQKEDFPSRDAFSFHMFKEHYEQKDQNKSSQNGNNNDLREIIMELKDKEINLMEMMLKQKKQMETQELQKAYQLELMKIKTEPNFSQRIKQNQQPKQDDELKGQSLHLFYQNKNAEQEEQYQMRLIKKRQEQSQTFKKQFKQERQKYEKQVYYDIFPGLSECKKPTPFPAHSQQSVQISNTKPYLSPKNLENRSQPVTRPAVFWDEGIRKPEKYFKEEMKTKTYQSNKPLQKKLNSPKNYSTVYQQKKKILIEDGHIFNSGPLVDDEGGDSDLEDYFDGRRSHDKSQIQDEEIKLPGNFSAKPLQNEYDSVRSSPHTNILDYSKEKSLLEFSKQKSSIMAISNSDSSFSKRDFELSKDDDTINLSDLKLSKLERKKQHQKQELKVGTASFGKDFKKNKQSKPDILTQFIRESSQQTSNEPSSIPDFEEPTYPRRINPVQVMESSKAGRSVLEEFMRE